MKIVFVYPNRINLEKLYQYKYIPIRQKTDKVKLVIPAGILSVQSNCKYPFQYIDNIVLKMSKERLAGEILKRKPDIVAIGGTMLGWPEASYIAKFLKNHNIITIYGGPNATCNPLKHIKYFDYVIRGRAELTFNRLIKEIENNNIKPFIDGVCYDDYISDPSPSILLNIKNINKNLINLDLYNRSVGKHIPCDTVFTTYGCPYNCKFCAAKYIWNRKYTIREFESIKSEIDNLINKYNTKSIFFRDDNFTINRQHMEKICTLMLEYKIPWKCQTRIDSINKETLKLLKRSGCIGIICSFESINNDTLEYINKGFNSDDIHKAVELFEKIQMPWSGGVLVGFPNEKEKHIKSTINFTKQISKNKYCGINTIPMRFIGIPRSELYEEIINENLIEYDWNDGEILIPHTKYLKSKEVEKIIDDCVN